ncbi:MAG TPA: hypothetical protein VFT45_00115 [Longimicrobium sp.]|nr:hypothetical protein [Longimicrobium sp.]
MTDTSESPPERLPDSGEPVPEPRPPWKRWRFPGIEFLSHAGTVLGAMCGVLALFWQLSEGKRERVERIRVETALPEIADDGKVHLRLIITNDGDRSVYIKRLFVARETAWPNRIDHTAFPNMLIFARDTSVKVEALEPVIFKSPSLAVLGAMGLGSGYQVEVETSQRKYTFQITPFTTEHRSELLRAIGQQSTAYDSAASERLREQASSECKSQIRTTRDTPVVDILVDGASSKKIRFPLLMGSRAEELCFRLSYQEWLTTIADNITSEIP